MFLQILEIVAPVFLLAGAGFVWQRRGYAFDLEFVTRMGMQLATPCLIFSVLSTVEIDPQAFRQVALAALAAYVAVGAVATALIAITGLDRRAFLAPAIFGNTGNMGLPLALLAFGDLGLGYAMVVFAVMAVLSFSIGVWMVSGDPSPAAALKQPIVYASVLGAVFALAGWRVPDFLANSIELTGQMAIPLLLITLGVSIAKLTVRDAGAMIALSLAKLVICGGAGVAAAALFGLDQVASGALILQLIMPVAVTSYMLAARYEAQPDRVAGLVVVSTLISIAAIPAALALLL